MLVDAFTLPWPVWVMLGCSFATAVLIAFAVLAANSEEI